MKWFKDIQTLEELKKAYKALAMQHHPDKGGNVDDMKAINAEYDILFEKLKNTHAANEGTAEQPNEFKDIIEKLIHLDGVQIEIIGSWIWVTGETYQYKAILKALNFQWSKSKKAWYFHGAGYSKRSKKKFTLNEIRDLYGSEVINSKPTLKLAIV